MKKYLSCIILGGLVLVMIQCKTIPPPSAEVTYVNEKNGVLYVRSSAYGKTNLASMDNAEKNAFEVLFFRGIPGSQQALPLISINEKGKSSSTKYFEEFYSNGRYKSFITSTAPYSGYQKTKSGIHVTADVGINLKSLRADLEHHNIIRKFGY